MANEKRLISLDEALKATHSEIYWTESLQAAVRSFLVQQPRVDAVEVVRCKDCKHWVQTDDVGYCDNPDGLDNYAHSYDFCSYGERREGE
jgi:hypothetical protein